MRTRTSAFAFFVVVIAFFFAAFTAQSELGRYTTASLPSCTAALEDLVVYDVTVQSFKECHSTVWTAVGGGGGAPTDAEYVVGAANGSLSAERVGTDTVTLDWDFGTAGQAKLNLLTQVVDLGTVYEIYEEFNGFGTTFGALGTHGWGVSSIGSGGTLNSVNPTPAQHPGLLSLEMSGTDNWGGGFYPIGVMAVSDVTGEDWLIDVLVGIGMNSTEITDTALWVGWSSAAGGILTADHGIWITRDTDLSHTAFIMAVCDSSTSGCQSAGDDTNQDTVTSSITPSAGNFYRFRLRRSTSGVGGNPTIYMRVNDETEKTFCSSGCDEDLGNLPASSSMFPVIVYVARSTATKTIYLDAAHIRIPGLVRY